MSFKMHLVHNNFKVGYFFSNFALGSSGFILCKFTQMTPIVIADVFCNSEYTAFLC